MEILVPSHVGIHNVVKTFFQIATAAAGVAEQAKITITQLQNPDRPADRTLWRPLNSSSALI